MVEYFRVGFLQLLHFFPPTSLYPQQFLRDSSCFRGIVYTSHLFRSPQNKDKEENKIIHQSDISICNKDGVLFNSVDTDCKWTQPSDLPITEDVSVSRVNQYDRIEPNLVNYCHCTDQFL